MNCFDIDMRETRQGIGAQRWRCRNSFLRHRNARLVRRVGGALRPEQQPVQLRITVALPHFQEPGKHRSLYLHEPHLTVERLLECSFPSRQPCISLAQAATTALPPESWPVRAPKAGHGLRKRECARRYQGMGAAATDGDAARPQGEHAHALPGQWRKRDTEPVPAPRPSQDRTPGL